MLSFSPKAIPRIHQDIYPVSNHLISNPANEPGQRVESYCLTYHVLQLQCNMEATCCELTLLPRLLKLKRQVVTLSVLLFAAEHFTWHRALASLRLSTYSLDILEADRVWFTYSPSLNVPCLTTHNTAMLLNPTGKYISRGSGSQLPENLEEQREPLKPCGVLFKLEKDTPSSALCKTHNLAGEVRGQRSMPTQLLCQALLYIQSTNCARVWNPG